MMSSRSSAGKCRPLSAEDRARDALEGYDEHQSRTNAFIRVDPERVLSDARDRDAELPRSPLHGEMIAYKDMFDRIGECATFGSSIPQQQPSAKTAAVLSAIEQAGGVLFGATNMAEFALGPTGHNATFGHCRNPHDPTRIAGGSSSGSAAAVASGVVFAAIGSDTGGSIRIPAACCGVVGLKPTAGQVSLDGAMLLSKSLDCLGPIARTASACEWLFAAMIGSHGDERAGRADIRQSGFEERPELLRLAVPLRAVEEAVIPSVFSAISDLADRLGTAGVATTEPTLPDLERLHRDAETIMKRESALEHEARLEKGRDLYSRHVRERVEAGFAVSSAEYDRTRNERPTHLKKFIEQTLEDAHALLVPVFGIETPSIAETDQELLGEKHPAIGQLTVWTRWANYLGVPALSVPVATSPAGLPIGVQLVGRPGSEFLLFSIAKLIERILAEPIAPASQE